MKTRRTAVAATLAMILLPVNLRAEEKVSLTALDNWQTEFSGREVVRRYRVESKRALDGRFVWTLLANERSLARGEQSIRIPADSAADVAIQFRLDPLREGVVLPAQLDVAVIHKETELARKGRTLSFFSDDPFASRSQWLTSLKIVLFDPATKTANVLNAHKIPHTETRNLEFVRQMKGGVLILGASTSLDAQRGLTDAVLAAASQGTRVLCLKLEEGVFPLASMANAEQLCFKNESIIRALDKRLDMPPWRPSDSQTASRLHFAVDNRQAVARVGDSGWSWLEARWPENGGRFVYCGLPIVQHWDVNPTPRYILLRILERLTAEE